MKNVVLKLAGMILVITKWTSHLSTDEEKQRFKNDILSARSVLERLEQMLKEEEGYLSQAEISSKIYDTPNWAYKQAHTNGFKGALNMLYKILTLDPKETK